MTKTGFVFLSLLMISPVSAEIISQHVQHGCKNDNFVLNGTHTKLYAKWQPNLYTCAVGYYLPAMCKLRPYEEFNDEYVALAKKKIEHLLRTALHFEQRKLVLGAWGCGAYNCPADKIAKIFKFVLNTPEFNNQFEEICFAILDLQGKNYQAFSKVFK